MTENLKISETWEAHDDLSKEEKSLHAWLDKCPNSVEIIEDDDGYWDVRVTLNDTLAARIFGRTGTEEY